MEQQTPSSLDDLTPEQAATLRAYVLDHGNSWRKQIMDDWMNAGTRWRGGEYAYLQQIRNQRGPRWLRALPDTAFEMRPIPHATPRQDDKVYIVEGRVTFEIVLGVHVPDTIASGHDKVWGPFDDLTAAKGAINTEHALAHLRPERLICDDPRADQGERLYCDDPHA